MAKASKAKAHGGNALFFIAFFKLLNATLLIIATVAIVHLFHKNVAQHAKSWLDSFAIDSDNQLVAAGLWRLRLLHTKQLQELALLSAFYSALFMTEGLGLALRQRWAEYLTLVATGLFVPLEIYELCKQPSVAKGVLLAINLAVVAYLTFVIRCRAGEEAK